MFPAIGCTLKQNVFHCLLQVVRGAKSAKITLYNNQSYDAELKGSEPDKDLAVLKITQPSNAKFVPISVGSSSGLQVSSWLNGPHGVLCGVLIPGCSGWQLEALSMP